MDPEEDEVSEAEARAELERLLSDPRFRATERAKSVLRYLADRYFKGETEGVKAYAIAIDVLGRSPRFDPNIDPIVRIELSRLRAALTAYYDAYGPQLDVIIHLPIGRYVTEFRRSNPAPVEAVEHELPLHPTELSQPSQNPRSTRRKLIVMALALAVVGIVIAGWNLRTPKTIVTLKPSVVLQVSSSAGEHPEEAEAIDDLLSLALAKFQTLELGTEERLVTGGLQPGNRDSRQSVYVLDVKYYENGRHQGVWWHVMDPERGIILASGQDDFIRGDDTSSYREELVTLLARRLAPARGIISTLELQKVHGDDALGNTCILRAEYALEDGSSLESRRATECLQKTLQRQPGNSDAAAMLARMQIERDEDAGSTASSSRALELAQRAVSLDPLSARAYVSLMQVQHRRGNAEAAITTGSYAVALNPDNPEVLAAVAKVSFLSGQESSAVTMATDAAKDVNSVPNDARLVLALDAYKKGDFSEASRFAEQILRDDPLVLALRTAAASETGSARAPERLATLTKLMPDYQASLPVWMERRKYPSGLAEQLLKSIEKARQAAPAS